MSRVTFTPIQKQALVLLKNKAIKNVMLSGGS